MNFTEIEIQIIEILRELKAHERIEIIKDQSGRLDTYVIHRSQKVVLQPRDSGSRIY